MYLYLFIRFFLRSFVFRLSRKAPLLLILMAANVQAHPHYWIDVRTEWQFDEGGLITGVRMRWLFDDYYSVLLVDDARSKGTDLASVLNRVMRNVKPHNYFMNVEQGAVRPAFGPVEQTKISLLGHRVELDFKLPFSKPLDPNHADINYRIAEPTYYFEILHAEESRAIELKGASTNCRYQMLPPQPKAELIAYAASLGLDDSANSSLGIQFAEKVTIRCD